MRSVLYKQPLYFSVMGPIKVGRLNIFPGSVCVLYKNRYILVYWGLTKWVVQISVQAVYIQAP